MFAVIKTGGKQYRVSKDDIIAIEKLEGDAGATIVFDEVLMLGDKVGAPRWPIPRSWAKSSASSATRRRSSSRSAAASTIAAAPLTGSTLLW